MTNAEIPIGLAMPPMLLANETFFQCGQSFICYSAARECR